MKEKKVNVQVDSSLAEHMCIYTCYCNGSAIFVSFPDDWQFVFLISLVT